MLRLLDAFAGIGGFHLGIKNACIDRGIEFQCVGAIEVDKAAAETYSTNFKNVPIFGDITKVNIDDLPEHDILTGGFPCPSFSINGKNHINLNEDSRAFLYINLKNILIKKQPKYFIFENVANIKKTKFDKGSKLTAFDVITSEFEEAGYSVYSKTLDSADFGVPQQRKRTYWVGVRNDINASYRFPEGMPRTCCLDDILDSEVDSKYLVENLWKNRKTTDTTSNLEKREKFKKHPHGRGTPRLEVLKWLYQNEGREPRHGKISPMAIITGDTPSGVSRQHDRIYSVKGIHPTIATFGLPVVDKKPNWRAITPRESHRLQGFPDHFKINKKESEAYRQAGNAVTVNVVDAVAKNLLDVVKDFL